MCWNLLMIFWPLQALPKLSHFTLYHALKQPAMTLLLFLSEMTHNHLFPWFKHTTVQEYFPTTFYRNVFRWSRCPLLYFLPIWVTREDLWLLTERSKVKPLPHFSVVFVLGLQRKRSRIEPLLSLVIKPLGAFYASGCFPEHTVMPSLRSHWSRATDWKTMLHLNQNADRGEPAPASSMWLFQRSRVSFEGCFVCYTGCRILEMTRNVRAGSRSQTEWFLLVSWRLFRCLSWSNEHRMSSHETDLFTIPNSAIISIWTQTFLIKLSELIC